MKPSHRIAGIGSAIRLIAPYLARRLPVVFAALLLTAGWAAAAFAQVSVTATAGTVGPTAYTTVKLAFDAVNAGTHQGAVTVSISANTTEGTTPATLNSSGAGAASYTSVLVQPVADGVSVSGNPVTGFGVIQLNGADNVTINGDNPNTGGTNRNLTVNNTTTATVIANSAIRIATSAAVTSADNNAIRNCSLNGNVTSGNASAITVTTGSSNSSFGIYVGGNGGATATGAPTAITSVTTNTAPSGTTVNALVIDNNAVNQCARAIVFNGAATTVSNGVTITNNLIGASGTPTPATPPYTTPATTVYTKGIWVAGTAAVTVTGNTIRNLMSYVQTTNTTVELVSPIGAAVTISNNTITNHTQNGTPNTTKSILVSSASTSYTISGNTITNTQSMAGSSGTDAIEATAGVTSGTIELNKITTVYNRSTGTIGAYGINLTAGSNVTIKNNFISDIKMDMTGGAAFSTTFGVHGIRIGQATAANHKVYHNSVNLSGALFGTANTSILTSAVTIVSALATGIDVRNNLLSNTLTGGTTSIAHVALYVPSAATSAMGLTLNNNAYYSGVDAARQGIGQAGATAGTGFYLASNFNAGATTPSTNLRAYTSTLSAAGTNDNGSLASTAAAPFTSSTDLHIPAATATNLESAGASGTGVTTDIDGQTRPGPAGSVNGGATANDIGADEFDGTPVDVTAPAISYTALTPTSSTSNRAFSPVTATDASGINGLSGTRPRVYYKKSGDVNTFVDNTATTNGWKFAEASGSTSPFSFTIDYSLLFSSPVIVGDVIQYFVVAQDLASTPNVTINSGTFATAPSSVNLAAANFPIGGTVRSYAIVGTPLSGDYTVGVSSFNLATGMNLSFERHVEMVTREVLEPVEPVTRGDAPGNIAFKTVTRQVEQVTWLPVESGQPYTGPLYKKRNEDANIPNAVMAGAYATITAAVNDLNLRGVSGPVRFLLIDSTYPTETFPITVNVVSASVPTAANPVTIKPSAGVTSSVSGAAAATSIFKIFNTNYITIDGSNTLGGTTRNLTIENTSVTTPNVVWIGSNGTTPITNGALKNCVVRNGVNTSSAVVISDGATVGTAGYFSDITIQNNSIQKAFIGVFATGGTTPQNGVNLTYADNELNSTGVNAVARTGLYMQGVNGGVVRNNDVGNIDKTSSESDNGIWLATGTTNVTVNANRVHDIGYTGTSGYGGRGIAVSTGLAAANITLSNNMISNITGDGDSFASFGMSFSPVGIYVFGAGQTGVSILDNSIFLFGNTINFSSAAYSAGIAIDDGATANASGNNVVNNLGRISLGTGAAAIALELTASQLTGGDRNNLFANSTGGGTNLVGKIAAVDYATLATWTAASGRDANSVSGNPFYVSTSDLHIDVTTPGSPVSNASVPLSIVTDFDGQARDGSTPDIGADEFTYVTHIITASAGAGGAIAPSGSVAVPEGTNKTFTITPDACHTIADVVVDGSSVGAVATYTFTNVLVDHTIAATFNLINYTITASAGANGSISPSGAVSVGCGSTRTFSIVPAGCYHILDVVVDAVSQGPVGSYTFTNVTANHAISASFAIDQYTIVSSAGPNGTITPNGSTTLNCGANQTYTMVASGGYYLQDLQVDAVSVSPTLSYTFLNVTANHTIAATFAVDVSTISVGSTASYLSPCNPCITLPVTIARSGGTPVLGYSVTFQLSPELTLCAGTSSISEGSFLSGSGLTLFNVVSNGGGSYTVDDAILTNCGPSATSGGLFTLAVSSSSPSGPGSITITSLKLRDCSNGSLATAIGAPATVPIDNAAPLVTVTAPNGAESWYVGNTENITWTATDNTGVANVDLAYSTDGGATFPNVIATGIANSGSYAWLIPNTPSSLARVRVTAHDVVCSAGFDASDANFSIGFPNQTITASAGAGGSISPSGAVSVVSGGNQAFAITANPCYSIADVLVDGVSVGAVSSYTFINVTSARTIAASFVINTFTITASAGANGSISPSGAVSVNCGSDQTFSIAAASCYSISDVLVDGGSVGAVSTYTFLNVTAAHTISASFSLNTYTITASAGAGGSISPSGAVTVNCGDNQSFSISFVGCNSIADVLVDGVSVGAVASYTFLNVQANHTIAASFTVGSQSIVASAGSGGSISPSGTVLVTCGNNQAFSITADPCNHILDVLVDGVSVGAVSSYTFINVQASHTIAASFAPTVSPVTAATGVTATQVKLGNDTDGTTKVTIAYSAPGAFAVEVWRKGFGSYPTYDNGGGSVPTVPGAYPPAGWTLTGVAASGQRDEPAARDFWYYVAYAKDACGNVSPVSNITSGTLNYHLGDVSNGITLGQGDNVVATADVSLLGAHYGLTGGALAGFEYLDVGPTTLINPNGRPTTDSKTNFEDLVIFALNYTPQVSAVAKLPVTSSIGVNEVAAEGPAAVEAGETFDVAINLSGAGNLQAASVGLKWDATIVEPIGMTGGDWVSERGGVVFSAVPGSVDAALLGKAEQGMVGQGVLATVRFRSIAKGAPAIGVATVIGRDNLNQAVKVSIGTSAAPVLPGRATLTQLQPVRPNPAPGRATIGYSLVKQGNVDLAIFSVDGRLVKSLARGTQDAGSYRITWDGVDDRGSVAKSGVYFVRFHAPGVQQTRVLNLVR